jgi:hypothetical protein
MFQNTNRDPIALINPGVMFSKSVPEKDLASAEYILVLTNILILVIVGFLVLCASLAFELLPRFLGERGALAGVLVGTVGYWLCCALALALASAVSASLVAVHKITKPEIEITHMNSVLGIVWVLWTFSFGASIIHTFRIWRYSGEYFRNN